ncbi:uncharacterized protein LOC129747629 isoform X2 [Uranotaenia lowii]|uniref:uncharacterized protein LOC129747629 isoform X2 n=1 Tax=Uranotaenia lowii TaxID=190385 RepID=UPI0024796268|nr:uncharacterized protein LOC129747629 isoform X2 [Uranotaenia lowii]
MAFFLLPRKRQRTQPVSRQVTPKQEAFLPNKNLRNRCIGSPDPEADLTRRRPYKRVYVCTYCDKKGHTKDYCYLRKRYNNTPRNYNSRQQSAVRFVDSPKPSGSTSALFKRLKLDMTSDSETEESCLMISSIKKINEPCYVKVVIDKRNFTMEIDSGSAETVISEEFFKRAFNNFELYNCNKRLVVIDGKRLKVLGKFNVCAQLNGVEALVHVVVLQCGNEFIPLMGRTWLDIFCVGWRKSFTKVADPEETIHLLKEEHIVQDITKCDLLAIS